MHNCHEADDGFKHLLAHVATSAFDADEEDDPPKCHPNTRTAVLEHILDWIRLQTVLRVNWILWLFGAAGAGKSAIIRSMVELCVRNQIPHAAFFFFRTDATRNSIKPLVGTLVYQLLSQLPDLRPIIISKIESDPLIFTKSLQSQLKYLIFDAICQLHRDSPLLKTIVLLIDGVDECHGEDTQANLISVMASLILAYNIPVIALFGSRAETHIKVSFQARDVSPTVLHVPLDDKYSPDDDIRRYVEDSFSTIKETHVLRGFIDRNWPQPILMEEIVSKSSGQFIYATVVMKFVRTSGMHPVQQLEIIRGIRPTGRLTPFAQLDALYRHIFSQVQDIDRVLSVLAYFILVDSPYLVDYHLVHGTTQADIQVSLSALISVISLEGEHLKFLHASLPDFLLDAGRSQEYYIDKSLWCTRFAIGTFKVAGKSPALIRDIVAYLPFVQPTAELRDSILACDWNILYKNQVSMHYIEYIDHLKNIKFDDDGALYRQQLVRITALIKRIGGTEYIGALEKNHDLTCGKEPPKKEERQKKEIRQKKDTQNKKEKQQKRRRKVIKVASQSSSSSIVTIEDTPSFSGSAVEDSIQVSPPQIPAEGPEGQDDASAGCTETVEPPRKRRRATLEGLPYIKRVWSLSQLDMSKANLNKS